VNAKRLDEQGGCFGKCWLNTASRSVGLRLFCVCPSVSGPVFAPADSSQHAPSETSEDPEVEVTIEGQCSVDWFQSVGHFWVQQLVSNACVLGTEEAGFCASVDCSLDRALLRERGSSRSSTKPERTEACWTDRAGFEMVRETFASFTYFSSVGNEEYLLLSSH